VNTLYLVAVGNIREHVMNWIENAASEWYPLPIRRLKALPIPEAAYDSKRKQYESVEIMRMVAQATPRDAGRVLGVTDVDIAIPMLSFLFGQAQVDGRIAIVSLCRLHQEFYGLPADDRVLRERAVKEVLHELGHTFGLVHCNDPRCVMSLATHIGLVDSKQEKYCERCGMQLVERFSSLEAEA
jgi:archaemetzincin